MNMNFIQRIKENILAFRKKNEPAQVINKPDTIEDPLPYIHTYSIYQSYAKADFNIENNDNLKISEKESDELLTKLFSKDNFFSLNKYRALFKIYEDCAEIHKALIPLMEINVYYSLDVVGGAARDFLLNNHDSIKDLDMLVRLGSPDDDKEMLSVFSPKIPRLNHQYLLNKNWCNLNDLEAVNFSDDDPIVIKHGKLAQLCLNRANFNVSAVLFSEDERTISKTSYGDNILNELGGIIKVNDNGLNYPVEVLLTDRRTKNFLKAIDFNLCNVGFSLFDMHTQPIVSFPSINDIRERFYAATEFFEDVHHKTITFNTHSKTKDQINYSFTNHLKRVAEKYPEHKLRLSENYLEPEIKKIIDTHLLTYQLDTTLEQPNITQSPKRKNKI